ncbi:unnamed protein product [Penicillium pancosmium]
MFLIKLIISLCLAISASLALNIPESHVPELKSQYQGQLALIQDYQDQIDKATTALQAYHGGIKNSLRTLSTLQATRQTAKNIDSALANFGDFTPLESAFLYNKSVETYPLMMNALNIGAVKASAAKTNYGPIVRAIARSFHDQDTGIMYRIHSKMTPEDQEQSKDNLARVADAYNAMLQAAT